MTWLHSAWSWILSFWPWVAGGGAAVAVVAFAALNPAAAIKLASAIGGFVMDALRNFVQWLRKPGSKLKAACAVLAMVAAIACLTSYQDNQRFLVVTQERAADARKFAAREAELQAVISTYQQQEIDFEAAVRQEAERLIEARAQSAAATAEVKRRQAAAEKSASAFKREAANKPDACKAALKALEAACPTLRDY